MTNSTNPPAEYHAPRSGAAELDFRLIVHPDCRRQSIGTRLMRAIESTFSNVERFELFTGERSADNIRLYGRLGYQIIRRERLSSTVTLIYMEKRR